MALQCSHQRLWVAALHIVKKSRARARSRRVLRVAAGQKVQRVLAGAAAYAARPRYVEESRSRSNVLIRSQAAALHIVVKSRGVPRSNLE